MDLGRRVRLDVATTRLETVAGRAVLLVERFDRSAEGGRRMMVSAHTILRLNEVGAPAPSDHGLADGIRSRFTRPKATLRELFSRIVCNICVSNTDDHSHNHAAFWDGDELTLTPAYDITPQALHVSVSVQAMEIGRNGFRSSRLAGCLDAAVDATSAAPKRQGSSGSRWKLSAPSGTTAKPVGLQDA